ncbi:MAG TPA: hypothetical protein VIM65_14470 [Cyclobacteriaceae bacterium]
MENLATYIDRKNDLVADLQRYIKNLHSTKEVRAQSWGLSIRSNFSRLGNLELFLSDVVSAKKNYYKAAKTTVEVFNIFLEDRYPNLQKKETPSFTGLFGTSFMDAVLCDSEELLMDYARTIEDMGIMDPPFNYEITYALKYLVLKNFEKAKEHAIKAHQPKYFKLPYKGFSHVVMGILEKDIDLVNEGIALRLKHHERENKNSIFYSTSIEATALAKLATRSGVTPDTSSAFINKALLNKDVGIQYEGIDEILKALEEADRRNSGLLNRFTGWFKKS